MYYRMKGGTPLVGEVHISGAKNAALGLIPAAIMSDETVTIENLPDVSDIHVMIDAIKEIGASVDYLDAHAAKINGADITAVKVDNEYIRSIRAGYYLLGALLGKYRHAEVALPGGCQFGKNGRPIDFHLKGFEALGATTIIKDGIVIVDAPDLHGGEVYFEKASVGATINVMLAASLAPGITHIYNAAKEPHVVDVAQLLNRMGANISLAGTDKITIRGVKSLHSAEYSVIPDQIEAGTFMAAAAITRGDIIIKDASPIHMKSISSKLREIGCEVLDNIEMSDDIRVIAKNAPLPCNVQTLEYPGFPTDMQPQICAVLSTATGSSIVTDTIYNDRFQYTKELEKMGAGFSVVKGNKTATAVITGVEQLHGADLYAPDLRAGAALVLAGLAADGTTIVHDIKYILRGYEDFAGKLRALGADIELVED